VPLKGSTPGDRILGWTPDSQDLVVARVDDGVLRFVKIEIASGTRSAMIEVESADKSGFVEFGDYVLAEDGDHYAYTATRQLSHLYLLQFPH
jgi:hypothetical protein